MRAASAKIVAQRLEHLCLRRLRASHQQRLRAHDHAIEAIAALSGLLVDECDLHGIGMIARAEALKGQDIPFSAAAYGNDAGTRGNTVNQHSAGPALAK